MIDLEKHVKKLVALHKKHGTYFPDTKRKSKTPLNPLSDFWKDKDGNALSETEAEIIKTAAFCVGETNGVKAFAEGGRHIKLGANGAKIGQVDRINGIWHIQNKFPYEITHVRDKDMVLMDKLDRVETTNFEFWSAKSVGYNCFGPFITSDKSPDYIVAKYETDEGTLYGYGETLERARAYLGLKLYDEYKEIIHQIACRNKLKGNTK